MEEKDEFSDILLERESEAKASKFKKIALIAAVFILIFLSVLIVMKIVNKPDKLDDSSRLTIGPKVTTEPTQEVKSDPLFEQVPIIEENSNKESFEEMVKKLKEKESKRIEQQKIIAQKDEQKPKETIVPIVETKDKTPTKKEAPVKIVKPTKVEQPKKTVKTQPKKPPKSIPTIPAPKKTAKSSVAKGIYIQVNATSKLKPDQKYLNSLKSKGYEYHLYNTTVKNKKFIKILVGPYKSTQEANKNLPKIKKELNKSAFIFRVL